MYTHIYAMYEIADMIKGPGVQYIHLLYITAKHRCHIANMVQKTHCAKWEYRPNICAYLCQKHNQLQHLLYILAIYV